MSACVKRGQISSSRVVGAFMPKLEMRRGGGRLLATRWQW